MFFGANSKQKGGHKSIIVFIVVTVKDVWGNTNYENCKKSSPKKSLYFFIFTFLSSEIN